MSNVAIKVEGLSKRYRIQGGSRANYNTLRDAITGMVKRPFRRREDDSESEFWALKDISFEVKPGEVIGLIGRNGAGKSTLLKILSRITDPTSGYAEIHGRVGSLLEVGTGFHPELSGRENIFLNGAILGMRRAEIIRKFDDIVAFAEVERFIDNPVKFYSSGMFVRLAFAVAAHLEPEILFVDEVLAVGDTAFQKKCLGKMGDVARSGRTVVLVSHNMGAISELCTHGVLLDGGKVSYVGKVEPAVEQYGRLLAGSSHEVILKESPHRPVNIVAARLMDDAGNAAKNFDLANAIVIEFDYIVRERTSGLQMALTLSRNYVDILQTFDTDDLDSPPPREAGRYTARLTMPGHFLKAGLYMVDVLIGNAQDLYQKIEGVLQFEIEELSENTHSRGYHQGSVGNIISPALWETLRSA